MTPVSCHLQQPAVVIDNPSRGSRERRCEATGHRHSQLQPPAPLKSSSAARHSSVCRSAPADIQNTANQNTAKKSQASLRNGRRLRLGEKKSDHIDGSIDRPIERGQAGGHGAIRAVQTDHYDRRLAWAGSAGCGHAVKYWPTGDRLCFDKPNYASPPPPLLIFMPRAC